MISTKNARDMSENVMIIKTRKLSAREVKKKLRDFIDEISDGCGPEIEQMADELKDYGDQFVDAMSGISREGGSGSYRSGSGMDGGGSGYGRGGYRGDMDERGGSFFRRGGRAWHRNEGTWEEREELRKRNEQKLQELDRQMQELRQHMQGM